MKRILSLLLVLSLCMAIVPVTSSAATAPEMLLDINYDDEISNLKPVSITLDGEGSVAYVNDDGNGKSLLVKNRWKDTYVTYITAPTNIFWVDTVVKGEDRHVDRNVIELWDNVTIVPKALVKVSKSGQFLDVNGKSYGFIDPTQEHRFTIKVNMGTGRYDMYYDGKLMGERIALPTYKSNIAKAGFSFGANEQAEGITKVDFFKIYYADELPELSDFPQPKYDTREKKLRKANVQEPTSESSELLYSEDFEGVKIGGRPTTFQDWSPQSVQEDYDGNKVYKFESKAGLDSMYMNIIMSAANMKTVPANYVAQFDVKCKTMSNMLDLFQIRAESGEYTFTVRLMPNGDLVTRDNRTLAANCYNQWVNVAIQTDLVNQNQDIYINGRKVITDFATEMDIPPNMQHYRVNLRGANFVSSDSEVMLDNIRFYSGTQVFDKNEEIKAADTGYVFAPKKVETWEHEIGTTPLNIDMTQFKAVPYQKREKESSNLNDHFDELPEYYKDMVVFAHNTSNMWIKDGKYTTSNPKIHWDDERFLAPAATLAALTGEKAEISGNTVTIGNLTAKVGEKKITVDGVEYETAIETRKLEGTIYLPIKEYTINKLKKYYSECEHGIALISDTQLDLTAEYNERSHIAPMVAYLVLDRPNAATLKAAFDKTTGKGTHPRLFGSKDRVLQIIEAAKTDKTLNDLLQGLIKFAEKSLSNKFSTGGHTVKNSSFEVVEAFYVAYLYTGDERYPKKAEELALLLTDMGTWKHDSYFLDVGTWLLVCAEVYDLFYHQLSQESRDRIATRMIDLGLRSANEHYYGSFSDWPTRLGNWNTVCNGGPAVAAAALYGDGYNDALCIDVLEKVVDSLSYAIWEYNPHGGLTESGHYWEFGTEYVTRIIEAFEFVFGDNYGLTDYPGLLAAPYWAFYGGTSSGDWAYHDDPPGYDWGRVNTSYSCWSAYRMKDYNLQRLRYDRLKDEGGSVYFYDVFYYMKDPNPQRGVIDLDKTFEHIEMAYSRNDATLGKEQFWLGIHALKNNGPHLQWDMGNFAYEAFGIRWAKDYGRDDYSLPDYDGEYENGRKGKVYTCRTEGHNLWVIEPNLYPGQHYYANGMIEEIGFSPVTAAYKVDLTEPYYSWVEKAQRGYMLTNQRTCLVIQDEITVREKYEGEMLKWFWHTDATPIVNADKSVTLVRDGFIVNLHFDSNVDYDVEALPTGPMASSPVAEGQLKLEGHDANKVEVTFYADEKDVTFRCIAMPIGYEMEKGEIVPVDEWVVEDGVLNTAKTQIDMIYINGKPLEGFHPDKLTYTLYDTFSIKGLPNITADANGEVKVLSVEGINDAIGVMVESPNGAKRVYGINLIDETLLGAPATGAALEVAAVTASDSDGNVPEGAVDHNLTTRWSGATQNEGWIQIDFGEEKEFDALVLSVFNGHQRRNRFDIVYSYDGKTWTDLKDGLESCGTTQNYEVINLPLTRARYVKLLCHGADISGYNSYQEILFWKL